MYQISGDKSARKRTFCICVALFALYVKFININREIDSFNYYIEMGYVREKAWWRKVRFFFI